MKKKSFSRAVCLLLTLVLMLGMAPLPARAVETDRFVLVAEIGGQLVIAPEYVAVRPGQTVRQALAASGHSFTGLEKDWITAIDGHESSALVRGDQNGGYDLNAPAAQVTHFRFCEGNDAAPGPELQLLMTVMADYRLEEPDVQKAAADAYEKACKSFVGASPKQAADLADGITDAITAYQDSLHGETFPVTFTGFGPAARITARNAQGREYTRQGDGPLQLPAGSYRYRASLDGNHVEGQVPVNGPVTLSGSFPTERWMGSMAFSDTYGPDFDAGLLSQQPWQDRALTVSVVDSFSGTLYTCAEHHAPTGTTPTLTAIYRNTQGAEVELPLAFGSRMVGPTGVLAADSRSNTVIYRISVTDARGRTLSQDYTVTFARIPTLKSLTLTDQDGRPQAADTRFRPTRYAYRYPVLDTVTSVTVDALPTSPDCTVTVDGQPLPVCVPLQTDGTGKPTSVTVTVSGSEYSTDYTLELVPGAGKTVTFKTTAANIQLKVVNRDGLELPYTRHVDAQNYNRYLYTLVPGEEYHYVAVRDTCFFAEDTFTLGQNSTITVDVPAESWLDAVTLRTGSGAGAPEIIPDTPFDRDRHLLTLAVPDNSSGLYLWVRSLPQDVTVEAIYDQIDDSAALHGVTNRVTLTSDAVRGVSLPNLLMNQNALGNTLRIRLSRQAPGSGITYYQDYVLEIRRSLSLAGLTARSQQGPVLLYPQGSQKPGFRNPQLHYTATVPMAQTRLQLLPVLFAPGAHNLCWGQTETGYQVQGMEDGVLTLPLSGTMEQQVLTVTVTNRFAPGSSTDYTVTVSKAAPLTLTVHTEPADAMIFVSEQGSAARLWPENGTVQLSQGFRYDFTVTAPGYAGRTGTLAVTQQDGSLQLELDGQPAAVTQGPGGARAELTFRLPVSPKNPALDPNIPAQWPSFRGNENHNAVTDAPIPFRADDAALYWAVQLGGGWGGNAAGCPIVVDGDLITYAASTLYRVDAVTGSILATGTMAGASSFSIIPPVYADGMIFMQLGNGMIQAFDARTLESLWVYRDPLKGQCNSPITVHNGYLYCGFWNNEKSPANFVCLSIHDEDPGRPLEAKSAVWRYTQPGGFYWAGAYVCDDYVLVGTDDGTGGYDTPSGRVLMLDPKTGRVLDTLEGMLGDVRCNIARDARTGRFCFTSKGGRFYSFRTEKQGDSWKFTDLWQLALQNGSPDSIPMSTSTPAIHNGRAYVGVSGPSQFGGEGHNITVIDLTRRAIAYRVSTAGYPQTSGLITTAYEAQSGYVYVYFIDNNSPGTLRVLRDRPGQTAPDYTVPEDGRALAYPLFTPTGDLAQFAICSPLCDDYGTLYFKNDSGRLMAVGSTVTSLEVVQGPAKTRYRAGECFDPAGMQVLAHYANGKTRDVTAYLSWDSQPLQAGTDGLTLEFPYMLSQNRENGSGMDTGVTVPRPHTEIALTVTASTPGDVNGDGRITAADAVLVLQAAEQLYQADAAAADVSGDGKVDRTDAELILMRVSGEIREFPADPT